MLLLTRAKKLQPEQIHTLPLPALKRAPLKSEFIQTQFPIPIGRRFLRTDNIRENH
jgi:hypothetical protein